MTAPFRILIVEDDPDVAEYLSLVLSRRAGMITETAPDAHQALERIAAGTYDVMLTDIQLPGMNGLDLASLVRERVPLQPIVVMTAHASVDYAMTAMRHKVDEFLFKPLRPAQLISSVTEAAQNGRRRRATARGQVVLAIGGHPDDVEMGVGGVLAAHRAVGDAVVVLTLSDGPPDSSPGGRRPGALAAAELLGARLYMDDLEDTGITAGPDTVQIIRRVIAEVSPTIVYTHSQHDRHQDHRAVHAATLEAAAEVPALACYQSPSSTVDFRPTHFVRVDGYTEQKLALLACYAGDRPSPEYRQPESVLATARYWARFGGGRSCEPLEVVRDSGGLVAAAEPTLEHFAPADRHDPQWVA